jgi:hypothetical protein
MEQMSEMENRYRVSGLQAILPEGTDPFLVLEKNFVSLCLRVKCGSIKTQAKTPGIAWKEITRRHQVTKDPILCVILQSPH